MAACDDGYMYPSGNLTILTTCVEGNWANELDDCQGIDKHCYKL